MSRRSKSRTRPVCPCQCPQLLDPFPRTNVLGGVAAFPPLYHYCCVCNIQLNSCRQALIHCSGKKHLKRLRYLQYCLSTSDLGSSLCAYPALRSNFVSMSFYQPTTYPSTTSTGYGTAGTTSASSGGSGVMSPSLGSAVSSVDGKNTETSSMISSASYQSDPVTKAVMDNIMGKLPTKKPTVAVRCDICNLEFSGQIVLETHLAGAKHAKKVKSQEILKQLQITGQSFTRDQKTNILKCEVCDVVVNSSQQLQTHLAGNRHKAKATKKGSTSSPGGFSSNGASTVKSENVSMEDASNGDDSKGCAENGEKTVEVPPGVQKVMEGSGSKTSKYFCDPCNVSLNSEIQLQQHLGSRKHKDKVNGSGKQRQRPAPYRRRPRQAFSPGFAQGAEQNRGLSSPKYTQPLSNNFVPEGTIM